MEKSLYYKLYYPPLQMVYGLDGACEVRMVHVEVKYHMAYIKMVHVKLGYLPMYFHNLKKNHNAGQGTVD